MRSQRKFAGISALMLCVLMSGAAMVQAQREHAPGPLGFLKRALAEAGAPALTAEQEAQLTTLLTNARESRPEPDAALEEAQAAYHKAIVAGDLATAQAQAAVIASRLTEVTTARLQAAAKLQIDVLAVLKSGGQWEALKQKFGEERLARLLGPLAGGPPFGGRPGGPGFGRGREPGAAPAGRPERTGRN